MAGLEEIKCKNCGADLDIRKGIEGVLVCEYCGSRFTLPKKETDSKALLLMRDAERNLDMRHFDDAYTLYKEAAEENGAEPEAYFGMALAAAQVHYLKDYRANGKEKSDASDYRLQPICYDISFDATQKKFSDDKNFRRALQLATPAQRKVYLEKGEEIDRIRSEFFALKKSGLTYDCFICVKVSSEDKKGHTEDALTATKLYHELKKAGYNPFFSEEEMKERSGARYEALILYALYCADCMLIVCSDESYLQTPWVKNEYSRYIKMLGENDKRRESVTIAFQGTPIEKLPGLPWKIQGIDLGVMDGLSRVLRFVDQFASAKTALPEIKRKDYSGITVQKRTTLKQDIQKRKIEIIRGGTVTVSDQVKLNNAEEFMKRGDFDRAMRFCMEVIRENPATGRAYWLLFLAENRCRDAKDLIFLNALSAPIENYDNFERALSATENAQERKEYYAVLSERVKKMRDLNTYSEFIALPEVTESQIAPLTKDMFETAKETKDGKMFSVLIKTVTNTEQYIAMNLEFAHLFGKETEAVFYYRNILNVDAGHAEALYICFVADHTLLDGEKLFAFCAKAENRNAIENELFAYGFNGYAMEKLMALACKNAGERAVPLFDFLLSLIPEKSDKLFKQYLNSFIKALFEAKDYGDTRKYADLLISADAYDDNAYFYRCMLEKKCSAPLELALYAEANALLDDENYMSAYNAYSVRHPKEENFYLKLNDALAGLAPLLQAPECRAFVLENFHLEKEEILTCKENIKQALDEQANVYWKKFKERFHVTHGHEVFQLYEDVTDDPNLRLAQIYAQSDYLQRTIDKIYREQPKQAQENTENKLLAIEEEKTKNRKTKFKTFLRVLFTLIFSVAPFVVGYFFGGIGSVVFAVPYGIFVWYIFATVKKSSKTLAITFVVIMAVLFVISFAIGSMKMAGVL